MNANRAAVVLFCGDPRREERQKRLPRRFLAILHRSLQRTLRGIQSDLFIASDDGDRFRISGASSASWQIGSLAGRVETAVRHCFSSGYARVLLLAGDVVDVARDDLAHALRLLETTAQRAVIGPSGDGGFYLAGFNAPPDLDWEHLFDDRSRSRDELADALRDHGYTIESMRRVDDIDNLADAERIVRELPGALAGELRAMLAAVVEYLAVPQPPYVAVTFSLGCGLRAPPSLRCV
jgi:glycosyltransferase A (GT-A) superfamily protein (DUF2064 family)